MYILLNNNRAGYKWKYNLFSYMICPNPGTKFREPYYSNHGDFPSCFILFVKMICVQEEKIRNAYSRTDQTIPFSPKPCKNAYLKVKTLIRLCVFGSC